MIKDPESAPSPYDALAEAGVTPWTSHADLRDVPFELLARRLMTPHTQAAWDALRTVPGRLLVDLFLYDVDLAAELPGAVAEIDRTLAEPGGPGPGAPLSEETAARLLTDLVRFDI
ncbi:hypothetical protein [Streptomyces flavofungini]|uniref:Uncharacterized protein n=1 Tax=Streptomyces flavofungini TaxID=68200 RepID=A0ABS0X8N6_9ACTN|nr:hypothetical protein [Streptomyces flavofungini]MBJ3809565.1 hypothetical protein [Streptomyces flavofungini]GHC55561.1 hypothetical protein GCM10010349_22320 [Streptomyces flavofungini]